MLLLLFGCLLLLSQILCDLTCPFHIDGKQCQGNSKCNPGTKCFFGDSNPIGWGKCCEADADGYYNAMFENLVEDSESRIPIDLFAPVREEMCQNSRDCLYPEVCMVSKKIGDPGIPSSIPINEGKLIPRHCYNKNPHWTSTAGSYQPEFCNKDSECSNKNCFQMTKPLRNYKMTRHWKTKKVIIYSPKNEGKLEKEVDNLELKMDESDEIDEDEIEWTMTLPDDVQLYYWKKLTGCKFIFKGKRFSGDIKTPTRIRGAKLSCVETDEGLHEDIEIVGANVTIQIETQTFTGLCGHPNLACPDCLINDQLFNCTVDEDCYTVADHEYISRNEKSFCSNETYNGKRLCKREKYTCPPDSLNEEASIPQSNKSCLVDEDCVNMMEFTNLDQVNETYYPHCFNGGCCARRNLCGDQMYFYALPLEANALRQPKQCYSNDDCKMFADVVGKCVFHKSVQRKFEIREEEFLNSRLKTKKRMYGMCCYSIKSACHDGGTPSKNVLSFGNCSSHSECNPNLPPFKWNSYCSIVGGSMNGTCCTDDSSNIMCPNGFTPFRSEPKCENVMVGFEDSGDCWKDNGLCYRGHCCPRLLVEKGSAIPPESSYLTETPCDSTKPLDVAYYWSYCDKETERVKILGSFNYLGEELDWQRDRCNVDSDCGHERFICVHRFYGIRYCVVDPDYNIDTNQIFLWRLVIWISAIIIGIGIIILFMPTPLY